MSYSDEILADSPDAYYRLGESSGTTAVDASGNGFVGTYTGTFTLGSGGIVGGGGDKSVTLGGGYIEYASGIAQSGDYTVEAWIYPTAYPADYALIVTSSSAGDSQNYVIELLADGSVDCGYGQSGEGYPRAASAASAIPLNAWTHLAYTFVKSTLTITLYINGVFVDDTVGTNNPPTAAQAFWLGKYKGSAFPFAGRMDECAVYPTALSAGRVLAHYEAGVAGGGGSFEEGAGSASLTFAAPAVGSSLASAAGVSSFTFSASGIGNTVGGSGTTYYHGVNFVTTGQNAYLVSYTVEA